MAFFDLIEDFYRPIARDGAAMVEVGIRLQKSLAALMAVEPAARAECEAEAKDALARADAALTSQADRDVLGSHLPLWSAKQPVARPS